MINKKIIFVLAILAVFVISTSNVEAWCWFGFIGNTCGVKGGTTTEPPSIEKPIDTVEPSSFEKPIDTTQPIIPEEPICGNNICEIGEEDPMSSVYCELDCVPEEPPMPIETFDVNGGDRPAIDINDVPENGDGNGGEGQDLNIRNLNVRETATISNLLRTRGIRVDGEILQITSDNPRPLRVRSSNQYNYIDLWGESQYLGLRLDYPDDDDDNDEMSFIIWDNVEKRFKFIKDSNILITIEEDGVLKLRDPGNYGRKQLDFTNGYAFWLFTNAENRERDPYLVLETPEHGDLIIGPRSSAELMDSFRLRSRKISLEPEHSGKAALKIENGDVIIRLGLGRENNNGGGIVEPGIGVDEEGNA